MGLKLKRFRAKLKWKTTETAAEVVCLRYRINSEFEDPPTMPQPIKKSKSPPTPPIGNFLEPDEIIKLPITPKGILKKSNHDDDQLDDFKKSTLIYMTENHDYDEIPKININSDTNGDKFQDPNDNKMVNWRETIEYHSDNDIEQAMPNYKVHYVNHQAVDSSWELKPVDSPIVDDLHHNKQSHYSSQAASIFFAGLEPKLTPRNRKIVSKQSVA